MNALPIEPTERDRERFRDITKAMGFALEYNRRLAANGDCESVQRQWDESFVHKALVDELQPVMSLTWEVRKLREENERLRNDAERYRWLRESVKKSGGIIKAQSYFWNYGGSRKRLDAAIDAARGAK